MRLDASLNHGSGSGDMFMYVPVADLGTSGFLYLLNQNGAANSGFEEWAAQTGPNSVPDSSSTLILLGIGLMGVAALRHKLCI